MDIDRKLVRQGKILSDIAALANSIQIDIDCFEMGELAGRMNEMLELEAERQALWR